MKNILLLVLIAITCVMGSSCTIGKRKLVAEKQPNGQTRYRVVRVVRVPLKPSGTLHMNAFSFSDSGTIVAGTAASVATIAFSARDCDFTVKDLHVDLPIDCKSVSSVKLTYKDQSGHERVAEAPVSVGDFTGARFANLDIFVKQNTEASVRVEVVTEDFSRVVSSPSGEIVNITVRHDQDFRAVDAGGYTTYSVGNADLHCGGEFRVFASVPTFRREYVENDRISAGSHQLIYSFSLSADPAGSINWKYIHFLVGSRGLTLKDFVLIEGQGRWINQIPAQLSDKGVLSINIGTLLDNTVEEVSAGNKRTYRLYAQVSMLDEYYSLAISPLEDTRYVGGVAAKDVGSWFCWSDKSADYFSNHSVESLDWHNGYLINDFRSGVKVYSY